MVPHDLSLDKPNLTLEADKVILNHTAEKHEEEK